MKKNPPSQPDPPPARRRMAEQKLHERKRPSDKSLSGQDALAMVHELQVHQIELEMQNDELQAAQDRIRQLADKYTELFDFAPIGYFVLDAGDGIREVNLAGAALLGLDRHQILNQSFKPYVAPDSRETFAAFCSDLRAGEDRRSCEVRLFGHDLSPRDVLIEGVGAGPGEDRNCWLAVRDITERRQIEDVLRFLAKFGGQERGEDFFREVARYLARSLGVEFVCIDRLLEDRLTARTVAVYSDGKFEDNVSYALKDTPCGDVAAQEICCFPRDVRQLFPRDKVLQQMSAESYVGALLRSSLQQPLGLIAAIGRRPLAHPELARTILQLVAVRAAGEMERRETDEALRASNAELTHFNHAMVDRELRMIDLKKRVNELCAKAGQPPEHKLESEPEMG